MKILLNKNLFVILLLIITMLGVLDYYRSVNYSGFYLDKSDNALLIVLNNARYFALTASNDNISDGVTNTKPFPTGTQDVNGATGIDFGLWNRTFIDIATYTPNFRNLTISRVNSADLNINLVVKTGYSNANAAYYTQIDYSGILEFKNEGNTITAIDGKCKYTFNKSIEYDLFNYGNRSIQIRKKYNNNLNFDIKLTINCQ